MRWLSLIPTGWFLLLLFSSPAAAITADRIMAVVNHEVIALSDIQIYRELFAQGRELDDSAVLKELIDQKLLLTEAKKLEISQPSNDEVAQAYQNLRLRFGRPETFERVKGRLSLTDDEIEQQLRQRLQTDKLIEQQIQYFVFVTPEEIEAYYQGHPDEFKNQKPEAAREAIREIRIAEKAQSKLRDYLDRLRAKADIRINRPLPE